MNLHALRIFVEVALRQSVTEAAAALAISQPAVSAQIRKLENELGVALVAPRGRGIALTDEGRFLLEKARRIYDWEREIEWQLAEIKQGKKGKLRIASTYLPSHYLVPKWLAAFKRQYEQVDVEIRTRNSAQSIELLLGGQVDLAIVIKESWDELPVRRVHMTDVLYWFILPADHPYAGKEVSMDQLVQEPFLLREQGSFDAGMAVFPLPRARRQAPARRAAIPRAGRVDPICTRRVRNDACPCAGRQGNGRSQRNRARDRPRRGDQAPCLHLHARGGSQPSPGGGAVFGDGFGDCRSRKPVKTDFLDRLVIFTEYSIS